MAEPLDHVAFDIETTRLDASDHVTVIGFELELGCHVFYRTAGRHLDDIDATVQDRTATQVSLSNHKSERTLLTAVAEFVRERFQAADVLLVGYNAETWSGGFDLPFLRTRFAARDVAWPFREVPYADLLPVIRKLFNTTIDGDEEADLETAYDVLCDGTAGAADPFDESVEAVTAFDEGRVDDVIVHNVADIRRTGALSRCAQRFCSKSDFKLKSLTPTVDG